MALDARGLSAYESSEAQKLSTTGKSNFTIPVPAARFLYQMSNKRILPLDEPSSDSQTNSNTSVISPEISKYGFDCVPNSHVGRRSFAATLKSELIYRARFYLMMTMKICIVFYTSIRNKRVAIRILNVLIMG